MQLEFFTCSPEDFEGYLKELKENWNSSVLSRTSKGKTEYGGKTSFYQYAHFFGYEVERFAEKFSLDPDKVTGFFYYLVSTLPQYGEAGMEAIKEYLEAKGEKYDRVDLLSQAALLDLDDTGGFLFKPIDEVFQDLFDVEEESTYKEIEFAKVCYFAVNLMKRADLIGKEKEMEEYAVAFIDENYEAKGPRECIRLLKEKAASTDMERPRLNEEAKRAYFKAISSWEDGGISDYPIASFIIHAEEVE